MAILTQSTFKIVQLNTENLFIYIDQLKHKNIDSMDEKEWQSLSNSTVDNKPIHKIRWLAESLKNMDPDVVVLSEVGGIESLENFNFHFLDNQYQVFLIEGNSDRGIDVGYLVHERLNKQSLLVSHKNRPLGFNYPHERIWNQNYKDDPDKKLFASHRFSRDVLELRLHDAEKNNIEIIFLACHLKSKLDREGIDPLGKDRRKAEFETLLKIYNEVREETGGKVPVIIAGDFNGQARASAPSEEFLNIQKTKLKDVFDLINLPEENRITRFNIRNGQPPEGQQIDYVFLSPELHNQLVHDQCFVYRYKGDLGVELPPIQSATQQFAMPSDHFPILVTLKLGSRN